MTATSSLNAARWLLAIAPLSLAGCGTGDSQKQISFYDVGVVGVGPDWASAFFWRPPADAQTCKVRQSYYCALTLCPSESASVPTIDAGDVAIVASESLSLEYANDYLPAPGTTPFIVPNDQVTFTVTGNAEVPAASATVVAPAALELAGDFANGAVPAQIDRAAPPALTWSPGSATVDATLRSGADSLRCRWAGSDGQGEFPTMLLAGLAAGPATFDLQVVTDTQVSIDTWRFTFSAVISQSSQPTELQ